MYTGIKEIFMPAAKKTNKTASKKACACKKNCKCAVKDTSFKTGLVIVVACITGLIVFGAYFWAAK